MRNNWLFFPNLEFDDRCSYISPIEFHLSQGFKAHLLSQFGSLVDSSLYHSNHLYCSGRLALQGAYSCLSKFTDSLFIWLSTGSNNCNILRKLSGNSCGSKYKICRSCAQMKHIRQNLMGLQFVFGSTNAENAIPMFFSEFANSTIRRFWKDIELHWGFPMLTLTAAFIPPFDNISPKVLSASIPLLNADECIDRPIDQSLSENDYRGCSSLAISRITLKRDAVEPKTGIKFPTRLDGPFGGEDNSNLNTEVLVGTGSRSMRIIKIKSLKVYAFGLYVHPNSVCEKLGPKYASVPVSELENCSDFYDDLLRQDIHMTVRLVVNFNGLKINTVRDAFEKSLRNRLQKMNPNTDYHCLSAFGAFFTQDIALPVGTAIHFRQTADGQLITEIGGKQIGTVRSKDLCRAFFDMYIGDVPVSVQAKQEIAQNVAGLIRGC